MSRFFVGQRVRCVRDLFGMTPWAVGNEYVIRDFDSGRRMTPIRFVGVRDASFSPDEIEPIQPSGHRASD